MPRSRGAINENALDGQRKEKTMKNLLKAAALAALAAGIAHATKKSKSKGGGRINCPKVMANEQSRIAARRMAGK